MRTTLVLEDTILINLKETAVREQRTLTEVMTETLLRGLGWKTAEPEPWKCRSFDLGGGFDYSNAWNRINELEADAVAEKMELRK